MGEGLSATGIRSSPDKATNHLAQFLTVNLGLSGLPRPLRLWRRRVVMSLRWLREAMG